MTSQKLKIFWAYGSEVVFSSFFLGGLLLYYDTPALSHFIQNFSADFATYSEIILGSSIAFVWRFYSKSDTPFYQWLHDEGAYNVYLTAYVSVVVIYASLTITLVLSPKFNNEIFSLATLWLLILGVINLYTFIINIYMELMLSMKFNSKVRSSNRRP